MSDILFPSIIVADDLFSFCCSFAGLFVQKEQEYSSINKKGKNTKKHDGLVLLFFK